MALLFLVAYAMPILQPDLKAGWQDAARVVTWLAWTSFAVDYLVRLSLSSSRWAFIRSHPIDLLVVVLPVLRPLRLLRLVALLSVLNRHAGGDALRGRVAVYLVGATSMVLLVASLAVLEAERGHEGANIKTYSDALWWSATTVTTVGYGDRFPVTSSGRLIAAGLMVGGIALLGTVTATFASYLVERVQAVEEEAQAATRRDVLALTAEVRALREELLRARS
jgi:voltage-gated potassium channel